MPQESILHYQISRKLGEGGMGEVYLATDTKLGREVALKFLPDAVQHDAEARERLIREAQAASKLNHPNIVTIFAVEEADDRLFISMEFVQGDSLDQWAARADRSPEDVLRISQPVAEALEKAHAAGIVHRDLKPSNILIDGDGRPRVMDFGIAKVRGVSRLTQTGSTLGTLMYTSPEQTQGGETDARSDIFSLGALLYELICGRLPFAGEHEAALLYAIVHEDPEPMGAHRSGIPDELQRIVFRCLAKRPEQRYQSAGELATDLQRLRRRLDVGKPVDGNDTPERSVAVLPFTNMSNDPEQEYFCDGIAEDIINNLCHIRDLRVAARTSSFAFKDRKEDVRNIGRQLNVEQVLEGSVRKAGNRIRITAQLVSVADGYHIWSERFDRELSDIFAVQDEISQSIARALQIKLSDRERRALQKAGTHDVDAYDLYLRGRRHSRRYGKNQQFALEMFLKAINLDPGYALAYAGTADLYALRFLYSSGREGDLQEAVKYSQRALELDPDLAEARAAFGHALSLKKRYAEADEQFEMAQKLNPSLYESYYYHARTHFIRGQLEQAAVLFDKAAETDPRDYQALGMKISALRGLGRVEEMEATAHRMIEIIERHLLDEPLDARAVYLGASAYLTIGNRDKALEWAERALNIDPNDTESGVLYNVSCLYAKMELKDKALDLLDRARLRGFAIASWIEHDSDFDPIRNEPRFTEIVEAIKTRVASQS